MIGQTTIRVMKIGGVMAVAAMVCLVLGWAQTNGTAVNGWTIAGVWCMAVFSVAFLSAVVIDGRRKAQRARHIGR